jgi:hypothetical protein
MARSPREQRREERVVRRGQLELISKMMSMPSGRDYFFDLLARCHIYHPSFAANALVMAYAEGERNIGLTLQADIMEANPDAFLLMLKERRNVRPQVDPEPESDDARWPDADSDA